MYRWWLEGVVVVDKREITYWPYPRNTILYVYSMEDIMRNEFTAIIEQDKEWFIAYSPEIPGANG